MVKSACGIEAVYMCFNGTGIWGGETISTHKGFACSGPFLTYSSCLIKNLQLDIYILLSFTIAVTI